VRRVDVTSAREMLAAAEEALAGRHSAGGVRHSRKRSRGPLTVFVATAAVADWRPAERAAKKLKKGEMSDTLKLVRNPDILKTVAAKFARARRRKVFIGFAAETGEPTAEAARKCREKGLDLVVANDVTAAGSGFGTATNRVTFVYADGRIERLPLLTKAAVARRIVRFASQTAAAAHR
jgi:phosphopantothenoylcysteine decarboxylase/phosphopantothenate--cysteine ligase